MVCSLPGSSVHGILQAGILERVAISFSRGSSQPRNRTQVSCIAGRFFTDWATRAYGNLQMLTLNDVGTGNQRELWLFFALKFKTVKDLHLLGLLRENLVRECTRGWMESGLPRWEKGGNQSTFWVPSPDPAFGAVWVFSPSSLSTLSPSPSLKCLPSNIPFKKVPVTRLSLAELEALSLCYKQHAGLSGMWFLVCLSLGHPLREETDCICLLYVPSTHPSAWHIVGT